MQHLTHVGAKHAGNLRFLTNIDSRKCCSAPDVFAPQTYSKSLHTRDLRTAPAISSGKLETLQCFHSRTPPSHINVRFPGFSSSMPSFLRCNMVLKTICILWAPLSCSSVHQLQERPVYYIHLRPKRTMILVQSKKVIQLPLFHLDNHFTLNPKPNPGP